MRAARSRSRRPSRWRASTTGRAASPRSTRSSPTTAASTAPPASRSPRPAGRSGRRPTSRWPPASSTCRRPTRTARLVRRRDARRDRRALCAVGRGGHRAGGPSTIAAFITEPVLCPRGPSSRRQLPAADPRALRPARHRPHLRRDHHRLLPRGAMFAAKLWDVWPDFLVVGKGISGGYTGLSAVILKDRFAQTFWGEPEDNVHFYSGHTYGANPLACAIGIAAIKQMLDGGSPPTYAIAASRLAPGFASYRRRLPVIGDVRGVGLLIGVEFVQDPRPASGSLRERRPASRSGRGPQRWPADPRQPLDGSAGSAPDDDGRPRWTTSSTASRTPWSRSWSRSRGARRPLRRSADGDESTRHGSHRPRQGRRHARQGPCLAAGVPLRCGLRPDPRAMRGVRSQVRGEGLPAARGPPPRR